MSDDLPTFDLPMNANSGNFCLGFSEILVLLPEKRASVIFIKWPDSLKRAQIYEIYFISFEIMVRVKGFLLNLLRY